MSRSRAASASGAAAPKRGPLPAYLGPKVPMTVKWPKALMEKARERHARTGEPVGDILIEYTAIGAGVDLTPLRTSGNQEALPLAG
jgi:hypothetical protein